VTRELVKEGWPGGRGGRGFPPARTTAGLACAPLQSPPFPSTALPCKEPPRGLIQHGAFGPQHCGRPCWLQYAIFQPVDLEQCHQPELAGGVAKLILLDVLSLTPPPPPLHRNKALLTGRTPRKIASCSRATCPHRDRTRLP